MTSLGLLLLSLAASPGWQTPLASPKGQAPNPVQISGDTFEINSRARSATYRGNVKALRGDATLACDQLVAHYSRLQSVDRIECVGNALAQQSDLKAGGERMDFDNHTGEVVVSGNPHGEQGNTQFAGEKFNLDLQTKTLVGKEVRTLASGEDVPGKNPAEITGEHFEVKGEKRVATWKGNVKIHRGTTRMRCDRLVAHYAEDNSLNRAECVGQVEATDKDKWAKGDRADYDVVKGLIVVTGNPEARQGRNHMVGSRFVVDLPADTIRGENVKSQFVPNTLGKP